MDSINTIESLEQCPKYIKCSANVCPIDPEWKKRTHMRGERVCIYLIEYFKEQGDLKRIPLAICKNLEKTGESILKKHYEIRKQVIISSQTPSKLAKKFN